MDSEFTATEHINAALAILAEEQEQPASAAEEKRGAIASLQHAAACLEGLAVRLATN